MKFVKENNEIEKHAIVTMDVCSEQLVVSVDGCNVFTLNSDGRFTVWKKHGIGELAEGRISDLEE